MLALQSSFLHGIVYPIHIRETNRIRMVLKLLHNFIRERCHCVRIVIFLHLIIKISILIRIGTLCHPSRHQHTGRGRERNLSLAFRTTLSSNKYYAIGTAYTKYRCCRSVFQYSNTLNFIRVYFIKTTLYTIHLNQRFRIIPCSLTTYIDTSCILSRFTGSLHSSNTRHLTRKHIGYRTDRTFQ